MKRTCDFDAPATTFSSTGASIAQKGHSKSANSMMVTGAASGPLAGEPSIDTFLTRSASKRLW